MDLQQVLNSSLSLRLVSSLAQSLPPRLGYRIAHSLADQIARRRSSSLVRAVRANQWVASGEAADSQTLDWAVRETLRCSARSFFDLYHYIHDFEATRQRIVFDSSFESILKRREFEDRGVLVAGLHLSNFDLILQWLCKGGMKLMVITIPTPKGGRQIEYEIRKRTGMNLIPASVAAFRQALKHLQRGGMVLTGIDRPVEKPEVQPRFFGRPAALPMYHIFLALKARVPIVITVTYLQPDGRYHVFASEPIEMDVCLNQEETMLHNAEKVLAVAETFIRRSPQQWSVPLPVWPHAVDQVPS
ncbi:MAG TPA: lysophospholipid acyltransferase family protein [Anaerolineales bacterium]